MRQTLLDGIMDAGIRSTQSTKEKWEEGGTLYGRPTVRGKGLRRCVERS